MKDTKQRIIIVGGGTAGWITASALAHQFQHQNITITLIESSDIPTIGVGEAVIPPFLAFIRNLGINEQEFISNVSGTFKLGIEFPDWSRKGDSYFHHFGALGRKLDGHDFYSCWLKTQREGSSSTLMDFSPSAVMAKHNKFYLPSKLPEHSPLREANYALHFDASLVAIELKKYAQNKGVELIDAKVNSVNLTPTNTVSSLDLSIGTTVKGDFFIDCSGFKGLLINEALGSEYESWEQYLPCNRAVAMQTECVGNTPAFTLASAQDAGWTWRIPLQHRTGNGYVYSDKFIGDDQAIETLKKIAKGKALQEPRILPFVTGMRPEFWKKNCLSLGLASGFLEPLESTAIHLVTRGVQFFLELFPNQHIDESGLETLAQEYNRRMAADYVEIRDFLVLHYCVSQRTDTKFWQHCREMPIPDTLTQRIALFQERGYLQPSNDELFKAASWQAVFDGMGIKPKHYHPSVDSLDSTRLRSALEAGRQHLQQAIIELPSHDEFLARFCPSDMKQ